LMAAAAARAVSARPFWPLTQVRALRLAIPISDGRSPTPNRYSRKTKDDDIAIKSGVNALTDNGGR